MNATHLLLDALADAEAELATLRTPPILPRTVTIWEDIEGLTPLQRKVLAHLVEGRDNKEIGRALNMAEGTVKRHLTGLMKRLACDSRLQVVVRYYKGMLA